MAIYKKGADPDALDRSAGVLTQAARECTTVRHAVNGVMGSLKGNWGGGDLQGLMDRWPPIEAQIEGFGTHLTSLGQALTRNATAQRGASGPGGSTGSGPGGVSPLPFGGNGSAPVSANFWDEYLEQSNVVPDGDAGILAWPGLITANLMMGVGAASAWARQIQIGGFKPRGPDGRFISPQMGSWARAWAMGSDSNWGPKPYQAANYARWGTAARWAGRAGTVVSFATSAFSQWNRDADDPNMGTTERVARSATVGTTTAAASWGGAWAGAQGGALVGAAVGGPVGAVVGGVIGGFIGGGLGGMAGDWIGQQIAGPVGDFAAWAGDGISEGVSDAADAVGDFASDVGDAVSFWD